MDELARYHSICQQMEVLRGKAGEMTDLGKELSRIQDRIGKGWSAEVASIPKGTEELV